jgi:hypothetical protein
LLVSLALKNQQKLLISNRLYKAVFNQAWIGYLLDKELSCRHVELDPGGYFIIYIDREKRSICAKHFTNIISINDIAHDPTAEDFIFSEEDLERIPTSIFSGKTAKEICVRIFEQTVPCPVTRLDHASYLGREFVKAEQALLTGKEYIQD